MTDAQRRYMKARQTVLETMVNPATELLDAASALVATQQPEINRLTLELQKAEVAVQMLRSMNEDGQFGARIALEQLWEELGVKHQTAAMAALRELRELAHS